MAIKQEHLKVLSRELDIRPHMNREAVQSLDEWTRLGKPYHWAQADTVETSEGIITLYEDAGYGTMALFVDDNLVDISHTIAFVETPQRTAIGVGPYLGFDYPKIYTRNE